MKSTITDISTLKIPKKYQLALKEITKHLQAFKEIEAIILYGSCAREEVHPKSNIDLCIITAVPEDTVLANKDINEIFYRLIAKELKMPIDMVIRSNFDKVVIEGLNDQNSRDHSIASEGIFLYKRDLN